MFLYRNVLRTGCLTVNLLKPIISRHWMKMMKGSWEVWGIWASSETCKLNKHDIENKCVVCLEKESHIISIYIYIYIWSPPPHDPPTSILYGNYQCFMHIFFLPEKWHSHVSISFTYYVSCRPRHTHTHAILFLFTFLSFLEVLVKNQKTLRKPNKNKKNKIARPM